MYLGTYIRYLPTTYHRSLSQSTPIQSPDLPANLKVAIAHVQSTPSFKPRSAPDDKPGWKISGVAARQLAIRYLSRPTLSIMINVDLEGRIDIEQNIEGGVTGNLHWFKLGACWSQEEGMRRASWKPMD